VTPVNITYNITDTEGVNESTLLLHYKTNSSTSDCYAYENGSVEDCGYRTDLSGGNDSSTWPFTLYDNQIYPGTYNFPERELELTPHLEYPLTGNNDFLKIRFYNVSSAKNFSFLEFMAQNLSAGSGTLRIYYCNSSYTGTITLSEACTNFYNLPASENYNHTHSVYTSHFAVPFALNSTLEQLAL